MAAVVIAALAAAGFSLSSLAALSGQALTARVRSLAIAIAAGILLAVAFADLLPESLELAGQAASAAFIGGFALMFLIETFTHAHTHHAPDEQTHAHDLTPFVIGLAIHNFADGFALGVSAALSPAAGSLVGLGVLIHQMPVGLSLAAVLSASHAAPRVVARAAILLGLAIPIGAAVTVALPVFGRTASGSLTAVAGGILAYMATNHLLPEAQAEHPSRTTGVVFTATLVLMTWLIFTWLAG